MKIPEQIIKLFEIFKNENYQLYLVGGSVRDLILGREVKDWDFTTDAKPEEILKLFPDGFYNNKFGTVGIPVKSVATSKNQYKSVKTEDLPVSTGSQVSTESTDIIEITTMRKEGDYVDHRHPEEVNWTDQIEEDLARRDFTINAIALSVIAKQEASGRHNEVRRYSVIPAKAGIHASVIPSDLSGEVTTKREVEGSLDEKAWIPDQVRDDENDNSWKLTDPFQGQKDLEKKLIKAVGDPNKRFSEDALRLMRAIRFSSQLEFEIEEKTFVALKKNAELIKEIAMERVRDELFKILASGNPLMGIVKLREAGILQIILPELERCFGIQQEGPKHDREYDIGEHSLLSLKLCPSEDPLVRFAALLHDVGKPDTVKTDSTGNVTFYNHDFVGGKIALEIAKRFHLSNEQSDKLMRLVRWHMFTVTEFQTDSAIRRFIKNVGVENIDDMMAVRIGDRLGGGTEKDISWRMKVFRERIDQVLEKPFSIADLKINGQDVMDTLNIPPGPKVGEVLNKLFKEVLEDANKNDKDYLLNRIKLVLG